MSKDAKIESENATLIAQQTEAPFEPAPASDADRNGIWGTRIWARQLSNSTQFVIAAAVILGLTMLFVGNLVSERIENAAVNSAAAAGAQYMGTFLEPYVQEMSRNNNLSDASVQSLDRLTQSHSLKQHIVSIKIWRADGTVVYSTNKAITNQQFPLEHVGEALKGKVVTDVEDPSQDENEWERKLDLPLYEIYAPLRDTGSSKVIAVGEFYEKAESLKVEINRVREEVWAVVGAATLAMLTLLFFIVRRGDKIIQRQQVALRLRLQEQTRLHISNAELQRKMATATQEFSRVNELTLRRIGADLHDGPAQLLTLILIRLDDLAENCTAVDQESMETIRGAATDALREVRDLSRGLALPEINDLSLVEQLQLVAQRHEQRTGTRVTLNLGPLPQVTSMPLKLCLYRFVQEVLNNAYRHANGEGQVIQATYVNELLNISVRDSGPGMAANALQLDTTGRSRLGLAGLRYRVESLGGLFRIDSSAAGTSVNAQFRL